MKQSKIGTFRITEYEDKKNTTVNQCDCSSDDDHFLLEYLINYGFISNPTTSSIDQLQQEFDQLLGHYDKLVCFLLRNRISIENDPFKIILERFLSEQDEIIQMYKTNLNSNIKEKLRSIKRRPHLRGKPSIENIYQSINQLETIKEINEQVENIKKSRQLKIQMSEQHVKLPESISKSFILK